MLSYMLSRFAWFVYGAIFGGVLMTLVCISMP